jgi:uracil permease
MARLIPFIIGIGAGYAAAALFTLIGKIAGLDYLMIINFAPVVDNFVAADGSFKGITAIIDYPHFALLEAVKELTSGNMSAEILAANKDAGLLNAGGIVEVIIAFLPVALVVFAEHIADHKNLSSIIDRDLIKDPGLEKTLLGDGVGSIMGTLFGICPNTTYGESVGCVAITRNASVATITTTAFMCIVLSFIKPIMVLLQTIPSCVMGGVCLTLYGFIAVSGLKMFKDLDLNDNKNLFVVAAVLISGIGGLSIQIPYQLASDGSVGATIQITSIATALIIGIVTNAVLTKVEKSRYGKENEDSSEE